MKKKIPLLLLAALLTAPLLQSCRTTASKDTTAPRPLPFAKYHDVPKANTLDESPLPTATEDKRQQELAARKMDIPQRTQSSRPKTDASDYPSALLKGIADPEEELLFEVNFDNAQLPEMVAAFAAPEVLNFSYLIDPAVKGAVTVNIKTTMKAREIWNTFQHLLWLAGAYASPSGGYINILPFEKMPKEQRLFAKHEAQPNVDVLFLPVKYKKSADVLNLLKPFLTDGATIYDLTDSNALILVETPANSAKLQELATLIDSKGEQEWPVRCYTCHEVDSDQVAQELLALLPVLGMPVAAATGPSGGAIKITSIPRMSAIVVSASMEEILDEVTTWIKLLDKQDTQDREDIFFYNVKHSTVAKVSAALDAFFNTATSGLSTTSSTTTRNTAGNLSTTSRNRNTNNRNTSGRNTTARNTTNRNTGNNANRNTGNANRNGNGANNAGANRQAAATATVPMHQTVFETDVIVFADEESNRLTIKTTPRTWKMVRAFLERQDIPPRQVSIRAIITNITLSKDNEFGISYAINRNTGHRDQNNVSALIGMSVPNSTLTPESTIPALMGNTGLGFLFKGGNSNSPLAFIKSIAGKGNTNILSEPHVLVVSGSTAKINVGQKIAIPTESTTYSSDDNMRSNYEYTDTGVIMEVTPYITAGNEVRLVVSQEISAAENSTDPNIPPVINTKTLSSELVIPDNSTLIMGGMIQSEKHRLYSGIPFLMDIPILGWLFRYSSVADCRTEMLILLTVNVVDSYNPQEELIRRYKSSLETIEASNKKNNLY